MNYFYEVTNEIVKSDGKITYDALKKNLTKTFCGPDYLCTLKSKLRCLVFKKGMKINTYITEVRRVISELYQITEEYAINQLTVNHIMSNLDSEMREQAHILQLTGSATPEGLLELIESKMRCHPFPTETASVKTANAETDRLGRLEKVVESLASQVCRMSVPETVQQQSRQGQVCENCKKLGHTKWQCFKLKKCYACSKVRHIAKHCRNKQQHQESITSSTGHTVMKDLEHSQFVALEASPRIYLEITVGGRD